LLFYLHHFHLASILSTIRYSPALYYFVSQYQRYLPLAK